jgi:hypothetical protein
MLTPERRREIEGAIGLLDRGIWPGPTAEMSRMVSALLAEIDRLKPFETAIRKMAEDVDEMWGQTPDVNPVEVVQEFDAMARCLARQDTWDKAIAVIREASGIDSR